MGSDEALIEVPDVRGLSLFQASQALSNAGLHDRSVTEEYSLTVARGFVIRHDPTAGSEVPANTVVKLVLSLGKRQVIVPDVVGMSQSVGSSAIVAANLTVGTVMQVFSDTIPKHEIMNQNPAGGNQVPFGSPVSMIVSKGPDLVTVPNVIDQPQASAQGAIVSARLTVGSVGEAFSDTIAEGSIVTQNPAGGTLVRAGSPVDLTVSKGPGVEVPDVVGLWQLEAAGAPYYSYAFRGIYVKPTEEYSAMVPAGIVLSQSPPPGDLIPPETGFDIVVSKGPGGDSGYPLPRQYSVDRFQEVGPIVTTLDGGFAIAGNRLTEAPRTEYMVLWKTDEAGDLLWERTYLEGSNVECRTMVRTSDGGFLMLGHGHDGSNHVLKTDELGNELWLNSYPNTPEDNKVFNSVDQTADGGFILAGTSNDEFAGTWYILKLDATGNEMWEKRFFDRDWDFAECFFIRETPDGGFIAGGREHLADDGTISHPPHYFTVRKLDAFGDELWWNTYGIREITCDQVLEASDGGFLFTGVAPSRVPDYSNPDDHPDEDIFVVKTDAAGVEEWTGLYGGFVDDGPLNSIIETSDGNYVLAGRTRSYPHDHLYSSSDDAYVLKLDATGNQMWSRVMGSGTDVGDDETFRSVVELADGTLVLLMKAARPKGEESYFEIRWMSKDGS